MKGKNKWLYSALAFLVGGGCCVLGAWNLTGANADETAENDHRVTYYVQAYKGYGANNKVESVSLPTGIGIKTLPKTQMNTNNRFNDSRNDSNPYALHPESETGDYNGNGGLWGIYYFSEIQHDSYGGATVAESDPLYTTPFKSVVSTGAEDWGSNQPIIYKFEMPNVTTTYDVVIGANAYALGDVWWGYGDRRTNDIYINGETTPRASYCNTMVSNYAEVHGVTAVEEECVDGTTRNILTITVKAQSGMVGPAVSFVSIAESNAPEPAYLASVGTVINVGVGEGLPETVEVLTTAGEKQVPITYTDTTEFDKTENKFLLNTVNVTGTIDVYGDKYTVTVPVQFIMEDVYYYVNATNTQGQAPIVQKTFAAMKAANATMLNDTWDQESVDGSWGAVAGTYNWLDWDQGWKMQSVYNVNPYASIKKAEATEKLDDVDKKVLKYVFPGLEAGEYTIYLGTREPDNWGSSRSMDVYANGVNLGTFSTTAYTNSLSSFKYEKSDDGELALHIYAPSDGDVFLGFIVIAKEQPINYGTDTDQAYFLNLGDTASSRVDGIERPYYQTSFFRAFNMPGGGEVVRDETGRAWGYYYNQDMADGYYATAGASEKNSPFDSMLYTNIDAANREMIFKFEMDDCTKKYDVVIGFYECAWGNGNGDHRGGAVYVNGSSEASATYTNQSYKNAVVLNGVSAVETDGDTGLHNVLTLSIQKLGDATESIVNFISIREQGKEEIFLSDCISTLAVDVAATSLPETVDVLTTAGIKTLPVTWTDKTAFEDEAGKYFLNKIDMTGEVVLNGEKIAITAQVAYIETSNIYYFANLTQLGNDGLFYFAPIWNKAFAAIKAANDTMRNEVPDAKSVDGSWGNANETSGTYWAYESPYVGIKEGNEVTSGVYHLTYNFPSLPEGRYLVQIGVKDPWGPRNTDVSVNSVSIGVLKTQTGKEVLTSFSFEQTTANADVKLDLTGTEGPLAGFIVIKKIDEVDSIDSLSVKTPANKFFYTVGDSLDVSGMTLLVVWNDVEFIVSVTEDMVSGFDASKAGEQTLTVTYADKSVQYSVTVMEANSGEDSGEEKTGCGAICLSSMAVVTLAMAAAIVFKKKED